MLFFSLISLELLPVPSAEARSEDDATVSVFSVISQETKTLFSLRFHSPYPSRFYLVSDPSMSVA